MSPHHQFNSRNISDNSKKRSMKLLIYLCFTVSLFFHTSASEKSINLSERNSKLQLRLDTDVFGGCDDYKPAACSSCFQLDVKENLSSFIK